MIRPMTAADLPVVGALQKHLTYADCGLLEAAVRGPFLGFVAVSEEPVGYAIAFPGDPVTLSELVVAPASRRHGYGRALLERVIETTDAPVVEVTTPVQNAAAKRFYAALEFEPADRIAGFYADGADALRLVRRE